MVFSAARQTIYALLSAIETDLRQLIKDNLDGKKNHEGLLGADVLLIALDRMKKDTDQPVSNPSLEELLYYTDFRDAYQTLNRNKELLPKSAASSIQENTKRFEALGQVRNRIAHSRPLQFDDFATTLDHSQTLCSSGVLPWDSVRETLAKLQVDPSFVLGIQIPTFSDSEPDAHKHNLPTPDFDETGFLGRHQQVQELLKLCRGPYPVITIVGEGGAGKTALAIKVAYDLLDQADCPYEAIVWTTSKTTQLTSQEIVRVENAICDSLGMLSRVAEQLGGVSIGERAMEEVLSYLKEFKILLILDNLETVLDGRVRDFLGKLPAGSKVLITSRIGIGAFEYPMKLQPLAGDEAVQLLRALAKSRGVADLVKTSDKNLTRYCGRMKNNPGFIKWFVSAVQVGKRPEEVLAKPDLFLDFCMSNVYSYLAEHSRAVLRAMLCLPEKHSQAELAYITELDHIDLQRALQQLLSTNMIVMLSIPRGSSFESQYGLAELARIYLQKHHPGSAEAWKRLMHRKQQMVAAGEQIRAERRSNPYSFYSLTMRSRSDLIVAKYLRDAVNEIRRKELEAAAQLVNKAKGLAPEYFEVHRIEALVAVNAGNYAAARSAYEAALELEPQSAPLHYWYAGFLLRYLNDVEGALLHYKEAAKLDTASHQVDLEIARCHLYLQQFDEASVIVERVRNRADLPEATLRKMHDLSLQVFARRAEHLLTQKDYFGALRCFEQLKVAYEAIPPTQVDEQMRKKLAKTRQSMQSCEYYPIDATARGRARALAEWVDRVVAGPAASLIAQPPAPNASCRGNVDSLPPEKEFGFVQAEDGRRLFFHRNNLTYDEQWRFLRKGITVVFGVGSNHVGPCAVDLAIEQPSPGRS